jgi:hypothetical protein
MAVKPFLSKVVRYSSLANAWRLVGIVVREASSKEDMVIAEEA